MSYRDPAFLRDHIKSIIAFYHPTCIDDEFGGYINQLRDDGSIYDRNTKHLVGTCRFIYNLGLDQRNLSRDPNPMKIMNKTIKFLCWIAVIVILYACGSTP